VGARSYPNVVQKMGGPRRGAPTNCDTTWTLYTARRFLQHYATIRRFDGYYHRLRPLAGSSDPKEIKSLPRSLLPPGIALALLLIAHPTKATAAVQQPAPVKPPTPVQQKGYTAEQIVESVILVYGSRPGLEQIRKQGIERGRVTRNMPEGATEESNYERRFVRGENLDKDKIRLDQRLPTMEYSLVYGGGKIWGLINGTAFTPREDAAASFLSQHRHSLDSLLRYKESGYTISSAGQEKQKGLELFMIDVEDKEKRKTRFYVSTKSLRVLWLEYEEAPTRGATPVKYTKRFMDYRIVQQTLVPYRIVLLEDGRQSQETRLLTVTYGVKVDDSIFKNPEA
jgi:hypothetical protein